MNIRILAIAQTIGIGFFAVPAHAKGPSFDCKKAATKVEKLICDDKELSEFDQDLSDRYKEFFAKLDDYERARLKRQQVAWLKDRDSCVATQPTAADQKKCVLQKMTDRCKIVCTHSIVDDDEAPKRSREVKDFVAHAMAPANIKAGASGDVELLASNEASTYDVQASLTVKSVTNISAMPSMYFISAEWKMDENSVFSGTVPPILIDVAITAEDQAVVAAASGKKVFLVMRPDGFRASPDGKIPFFTALESCANDRFKRCTLLAEGKPNGPQTASIDAGGPLEKQSYFDASKELHIASYLDDRFKRTPFQNDGEKSVRIEATILKVGTDAVLAASNAQLGNNRIPVDFPRNATVDRAFLRALDFNVATARQMRGIMREAGNPNWVTQIADTTVYVVARPAGQSRQTLPNGTSSDVLRFTIEAMCTGSFFSQCIKISDFSAAH